MQLGESMVYHFKEVKVNKHSTIYGLENPTMLNGFITELIKIEKFQGFSRAINTDFYLKVRTNPNWAKCEQVTGLWKTSTTGVFYGDRKTDGLKTLILFKFYQSREKLIVVVYPTGYYPPQSVIFQLAGAL